MSGKSRIAIEFISCPVFMIDINMCPVSLGLRVVTDVLSMTMLFTCHYKLDPK